MSTIERAVKGEEREGLKIAGSLGGGGGGALVM